MELEQNQPASLQTPAPESNHTTAKLEEWMDFCAALPAGIFIFDDQSGVVHINPKMRDYLKLDKMPISPVLEDYFWSRLESMGEDPSQVRNLVTVAKQSLLAKPPAEFRISTAENRCLFIRITRLQLEEDAAQIYAGIALELIDERTMYKRQLKMVEGMSVQARKTSAGAGGNLKALVGNIRSWNPDVLEGFLSDAWEQQNLVNESLDLILNLIRAFENIPVFWDTVYILDIVNEVASGSGQIEIRVIEIEDQTPLSPLSAIDPSLTRLALDYLVNELIIHNPGVNYVEASISARNDDLVLKLECPSTLPLPGLSPEKDDLDLSGQNVRMYLAEEIIAAQGGSLAIFGPGADSISITRMEIQLPAASFPEPPPKSGSRASMESSAGGRILLAEAQPEYQIMLRDALEDAGYRVDLALEGSAALDMTQIIHPDLVIISRNLPGLDGLLVTQGVRRWSAIPIIMLSERSNPDDLLYAYQLGVDDYLRKPFPIQELLARVKVCLARSENSRSPLTPDLFQSNLIKIDYSARQVWVRGKPVDLTPIEYNLLAFMSRQGKQIMPYEQLLESVWEGPEKGSRQGLFVHVKRLREKIEEDPKNPKIINNKWGVGYEFNP